MAGTEMTADEKRAMQVVLNGIPYGGGMINTEVRTVSDVIAVLETLSTQLKCIAVENEKTKHDYYQLADDVTAMRRVFGLPTD